MSSDRATVAVSKFIDATGELMECVQADIRDGGQVSNETVVALARLISLTEKLERVLERIKMNSEQLN